jgi:hypothetical protein
MEFIFQILADLFLPEEEKVKTTAVEEFNEPDAVAEAPLAEAPAEEANIFTMMEFH